MLQGTFSVLFSSMFNASCKALVYFLKTIPKGAKITLKSIVEFRFPSGDIFGLALNVLHVKQHYSIRLKLRLLAVFWKLTQILKAEKAFWEI